LKNEKKPTNFDYEGKDDPRMYNIKDETEEILLQSCKDLI